jgi:hypothetical protein
MSLRLSRVLFVAVLLAGIVAVAPPSGAAPVIQPGASITMDGSYCTLNWIYDGGGGPYGGTAAHCVDGVGQRVSLSTTSLGTAILEFGTVALYRPNLDYALIRIDPEDVGLVSPAMKGHPNIPAGVSTVDTAAVGDLMQFSGHGVGFHATTVTQEQRRGVLGYNDGEQHFIYGPVTFGDSGGPVADISDGNKAFGIANTLGVALTPLPQAGEGGLSLDALLADAASQGFAVQVRTI